MIFGPQQLKSGWRGALALVIVAALGSFFWQHAVPAAAEAGVEVPPAQTTLQGNSETTAMAVLAGGCFWGMEAVYEHVKGVIDVISGYAGGVKEHANYEDSSTGRYDDAEAVRISYDPSKISYAELLQIYFSVAHDPTQVNRQGPDRGTQYRSEIFAAGEDQARVARAYIQQLEDAEVFDSLIVTKVSVNGSFFSAEPYHQNYAARNPDSLYIRVHDVPKIEALEHRFAQRYRDRSQRRTAVGQ